MSIKRVTIMLLLWLNVKVECLCNPIECRSCRYFYKDYSCKIFAKNEKYENKIVYNYKLKDESETFKYISVLNARKNENLCGLRGHFFEPIIFKSGLNKSNNINI